MVQNTILKNIEKLSDEEKSIIEVKDIIEFIQNTSPMLSQQFAIPKEEFIRLNEKFLNFEMIKWAKNNNIKIYCFTVNNKKELSKAKKHEIDGIFTDDPKKMKEIIKNYELINK